MLLSKINKTQSAQLVMMEEIKGEYVEFDSKAEIKKYVEIDYKAVVKNEIKIATNSCKFISPSKEIRGKYLDYDITEQT